MRLFKPFLFLAFSVLGGALALAPAAWAEGDAKAGQRVFNQCRACHTLDPGKNRVGPSLAGVFGRKAGTLEGFNFSKAMRESGVVWDEETLDQYLAKPRDFMPGNRMSFAGLRKPEQRADLIAYLKEATKSR